MPVVASEQKGGCDVTLLLKGRVRVSASGQHAQEAHGGLQQPSLETHTPCGDLRRACSP